MSMIREQNVDTCRNQYAINLVGHGSIIMWNNMKQFHEDIEPTLEYCCRNMPEYMNKYNK